MQQSVQGGGGRAYAEPHAGGVSPFTPTSRRGPRYPLALHGFSVIDLHDHQRWVLGMDNQQAIFDGQLYRFADARQRAIFAAAPQRYVPVLGGDCLVTFAETGRRTAGDFRYGLQHGQRLFFFAGSEQQEQFRENPERYVDADLAHSGNCVVSKFDQQQLVKGLPETVATIGGLRYFFLGAQQQSQFLGNLEHYGAEIIVPSESEPPQDIQKAAPSDILRPEGPKNQPEPHDSEPSAKRQEIKVEPRNKAEEEQLGELSMESSDGKPVLAGYCPVTIQDEGVWKEGDSRFRAEYDGKTYLFAGEAERALFVKAPWSYVPAMAGNCAISLLNLGKQIPGSIFHTASYMGRLYLFAGSDERLAFTADPLSYADLDLAMEGNCVVTHVDKKETVAGLEEHMTWFHGIRYFFASPETKAKFLADPETYANPLNAKKQ